MSLFEALTVQFLYAPKSEASGYLIFIRLFVDSCILPANTLGNKEIHGTSNHLSELLSGTFRR